jgi:hypothetical protein
MTFAKSIIPVWVYRRHHATVRAATMPFKIAMLYPMWKECPVSFLNLAGERGVGGNIPGSKESK